jgi:hypothetical protein
MSPQTLASFEAYRAACVSTQKPLGPVPLCYDPALLGGFLILKSELQDMSSENLAACGMMKLSNPNSYNTACGGFFSPLERSSECPK